MSKVLHAIASYYPPPQLRLVLEDPENPLKVTGERFQAAVLFADVSGFTPLTEALAQKGSAGVEEMTSVLNEYFSQVIDLLEQQGGEVVKFSGDAMTVVFPAFNEPLGHAVRRAFQGAEEIHGLMSEFGSLETSVGEISLGLKAAIGAGELLGMQVGGHNDKWEYVIAGDPVRQFSEAEGQAERGETVLSPEAQSVLYPKQLDPSPLGGVDWGQREDLDAIEEQLRQNLPDAIRGWFGEGLSEWLAVLRPMTVLFIGVGGLDYERPKAVDHLHTFFHRVQSTVAQYEGTINKLAVDDKGTVVLAMFGAPPYSHPDDPALAVNCALELQSIAKELGLRFAIGIATGRVFAGPVGGETRREYTVMGDTVNLAARLMGKAGSGNIMCDPDTHQLTRTKFNFERSKPIQLKGIEGEFQFFRPTAPKEEKTEVSLEVEHPLVGREDELRLLEAKLDAVREGKSRIVILDGETGIGKSRLIFEAARKTRTMGMMTMVGRGQSIEKFTTYRAWRDVYSSYFDLEEITEPELRRERVREYVSKSAPEQILRVPLLNDVLDLGFPDTDLTANLDPDLRKESLAVLLIRLLRVRAEENPIVLILEDAQWLDSVSWELTVQVARALTVSEVPILLIVAARSEKEGEAGLEYLEALRELKDTEIISLDLLNTEEIVRLVEALLDVPEGGLPEAVQALVTNRSGGNPFFAEELVLTLRDQGIITIESEPAREGSKRPHRVTFKGDLSQTEKALPDTIEGLILARIDRLPPERQLVLKVGAVIGRSFQFMPLNYTLKNHTAISEVVAKLHLDELDATDLTELEATEPDLSYIFKNIVTQEVSYETLLYAQRRQLHRTVAEWYERSFGGRTNGEIPKTENLAPYYPLLVYHYQHAEDRRRERVYARLAGEQAAAQFGNAEAATYFSRALELTPENELSEQYEMLSERERLYDLLGEREAQQHDLEAMEHIAERMDDSKRRAFVALRKADLEESLGNYREAISATKEAVVIAKDQPWENTEAEGYMRWGVSLWRLGDLDSAQGKLELALERSELLSRVRADILRNLGNIWSFKDSLKSREYYQQALQIYQEIGDLRGESQALNNLGLISRFRADFSKAIDYFNQAFQLAEKLGDRRAESRAMINLGYINAVDLGNYQRARDYYEHAMLVFKEIGERHGLSLALLNLSLLFHNVGDQKEAVQYCREAMDISQSVGDRDTEGFSWTFLGHTLTGLGEMKEAEGAFRRALEIRRELSQPNLATEPLAGLANVALAQRDFSAAQQYAEEIWAFLKDNSLEGTEEPLRVYLVLYKVLKAIDDPRAEEVLSTAWGELEEKAEKIEDEAQRRSFLENVPVHREILEAHQ